MIVTDVLLHVYKIQKHCVLSIIMCVCGRIQRKDFKSAHMKRNKYLSKHVAVHNLHWNYPLKKGHFQKRETTLNIGGVRQVHDAAEPYRSVPSI